MTSTLRLNAASLAPESRCPCLAKRQPSCARMNLQLKILLQELRITANSPSLVCRPVLRVRWRARASAIPRINLWRSWLHSPTSLSRAPVIPDSQLGAPILSLVARSTPVQSPGTSCPVWPELTCTPPSEPAPSCPLPYPCCPLQSSGNQIFVKAFYLLGTFIGFWNFMGGCRMQIWPF